MRIPYQFFLILMLFSLECFAILNINIVYAMQIMSICLSGVFICIMQRQLDIRRKLDGGKK
jgi:hypothetical protein